jgi:DNA-binding IclR family transcriptional regulator
MNEPSITKAVVKTMRILELLSEEDEIGITKLANRLNDGNDGPRIHKSTVHRFLNSLKELGYVRQDPLNEQYRLTLKIFEIGTAVLERLQLWREANTILKRIALETRETVHLASLEGNRLVYIAKIESTKTLRVSMQSEVGRNASIYCTGLGKALLAYLETGRVSEILADEKMVKFTEHTINNRNDLDKEFARIRDRGYAIDNEEHEIGVRCVAAPVRDNTGAVIAAISISMPSMRLALSDIPKYADIVVGAAGEISARLGYRAR